MKKILSLFAIFSVAILMSGCTKQVVFEGKNVEQTKLSFDNFIKSTGYSYKVKDDVNNIYNVHIMTYNLQYLLQSQPMMSQNYGFTCKFKPLNNGKDTLLDCKTYPTMSNNGIWDVKRYLKEQKWDNVKYVSYKKYRKEK